jgi:hypothetical protein
MSTRIISNAKFDAVLDQVLLRLGSEGLMPGSGGESFPKSVMTSCE